MSHDSTTLLYSLNKYIFNNWWQISQNSLNVAHNLTIAGVHCRGSQIISFAGMKKQDSLETREWDSRFFQVVSPAWIYKINEHDKGQE